MKLKVRCVSNDLPTLELLFECGEGQQTFKWLGLAVAQRYSFLKIPQGRYRAREQSTTPQGFYLPTSLSSKAFKASASGPFPYDKIRDVLKDGDEVEVGLKYELSLDELGCPVLSEWAKDAFFFKEARKKEDRDPVMERRLQAADQMLALRQAMADDSEGRRLSVDMKVAITGHIETPSEVRAALAYDWPIMGVVEEGPLFPAAAVSRVREVVQELFRELNGVFLYYCGLPRLGDPLYGLTLAELSHLLHRARVCHVTRDKDAVTKAFLAAQAPPDSTTTTNNNSSQPSAAVAGKPGGAVGASKGAQPDPPASSSSSAPRPLTRAEFLGALVRLGRGINLPPSSSYFNYNNNNQDGDDSSLRTTSSTSWSSTSSAAAALSRTTARDGGSSTLRGAGDAPPLPGVETVLWVLQSVANTLFPEKPAQPDPLTLLLRTKLSPVVESHRHHLRRIFFDTHKGGAMAAAASSAGGKDVLPFKRFCEMLIKAAILSSGSQQDDDAAAAGLASTQLSSTTTSSRFILDGETEEVVLRALSALGYSAQESRDGGVVFAEWLEAACRVATDERATGATRQQQQGYSLEQKLQLAISALLDIGELGAA